MFGTVCFTGISISTSVLQVEGCGRYLNSVFCTEHRKHFKQRTHSATYKTNYTDACKTYRTMFAYTTVFLKMKPRVRNM